MLRDVNLITKTVQNNINCSGESGSCNVREMMGLHQENAGKAVGRPRSFGWRDVSSISPRIEFYAFHQSRILGSAATGATMVIPIFVTMVVKYFVQPSFSSHFILPCIFGSLLEQFCLLVTLQYDQLQESMSFMNFTGIELPSYKHTLVVTQHLIFCVLRP